MSRSRSALAAENLFLRKQLALFQERQIKPLTWTALGHHGQECEPKAQTNASFGVISGAQVQARRDNPVGEILTRRLFRGVLA